jgi:flagellar motor switch protein FliN/FliY
MTEQATANETTQDPAVDVAEAQLPEAQNHPTHAGSGQIDILLDTRMAVTAVLGEAEIEVRELLQLGEGSVLKLDRRAGEPVDLYLRGIRFARGSLVVAGEQLAVRISEILPSAASAASQLEEDGE